MSTHIVSRVVIRGLVQGVGYRNWTEYVAGKHGLQGFVRNRRDGAVEAVFGGPAEKVAAMIEACRCGPSNARVEAVEEYPASAGDLDVRIGNERFSSLPSV
jgi:acylphosphatase